MKVFLFLTLLFGSVLSYSSCIDSSENLTIDDLKKSLICFQNEIDILKKSKGSITVNTHENLPKPTISKTKSKGNLQVDLIQCKRDGTRATCNFVVINKDEDFKASLYVKSNRRTEAYDEHGFQYRPSMGKIVNKSSERSITHKLIKDVPVKASLVFNDIQENATQFTVLDIYLNISKRKVETVQFRNVVIK
ncbi:MAG: hypothetical protein U9O24_05370 [Campylobacterota bacterium]|nr:hypothetical protein [Campylobacterota bacterium]